MNSKSVILAFLWMLCFTAFAQAQVTATGVVVDAATGEPIIGAGIVIPGKAGGAITDVDGHYSIAAKAGDVLEFSAIGYKTTQVTVGAGNVVDVILPDDVDLLNEAIVTGYGAVSKKNLTTAIAKVAVDDVQKTGTTNMSQLLMGRAAGLQAGLQSGSMAYPRCADICAKFTECS